jgi:hypothetical protein
MDISWHLATILMRTEQAVPGQQVTKAAQGIP